MKKEERELRKMQVRLNNKEKQEELKVEHERLDNVLHLVANSISRSTVSIKIGSWAGIMIKLLGLYLLLCANAIKYAIAAKVEVIRTGDDIKAFTKYTLECRDYVVKSYLTSQPMIASFDQYLIEQVLFQ